MIRSVMITPEGEVTREPTQTTFKVSVKVTHDEGVIDTTSVIGTTGIIDTTGVIPIIREVSFKNDILPILKDRCQECHRRRLGGRLPEGRLDLTSSAGIMKGAVVDPWLERGQSYRLANY